MRRSIPLDKAYRLIGPGPVVLVSSLYGARPAITPIAWHMPISDDPPIVALEIDAGHAIYKAIVKTGDFVINIPPSTMAPVVRKLGSVSSAAVDKFAAYGLVGEKAKKVKSPRLKTAIGILECRLRREKQILARYNIVIGDVVYAEAEKGVFTDRWCPERKGPRIMQHLAGGTFSVSDKIV